jgi:PAS domain S-box-containing protein/putative nucleotidyltransferase with HDIG domain
MRAFFIALLILPGWLLLSLYLIYEYHDYGPELMSHLLAVDRLDRIVFHLIMLLAPVASTSFGIFVFERLRLSDTLREVSERYMDYYENAPDGYHSIGPDMTLLEVNETWLEMFGYSREEVVGRMKAQDLLPEESRLEAGEIFRKLKEKGRFDDEEMVFLREDGTRVPVLVSSTAMYGDDGEFQRSRTIVKDISDRKIIENELVHVAEQWRSTFESMPWGIMLLDRDCSVLQKNRYFQFHPELDPVALASTRCRSTLGKLAMVSAGARSSLVEEYHDPELDRHFQLSMSAVGNGGGYVVSLVDMSELKQSERKLIESRNAFFNMLKDVSYAYEELEEVHQGLILALANAIDAKSPWTKGHSERVTRYSMALAEAMDIGHRDLEKLRTAALLHDIGKIGTYDMLLEKPTSLTDDEYSVVKRHPEKAAEILRPIGRFGDIIDMVKFHHERYDGKGYPDGLAGEEIPLMARILCIADSYDSMTADRPYRLARDAEFAVGELKRCSGTHFDPALVEEFVKLIDEGRV